MGKSAKWNSDEAFKGTHSDIDRISNLPGPLLTHILSSLPTKCAVATSVLSTKWRFVWTSITNLDFDDSGYFPKKVLNMKRERERDKLLNMKRDKFNKFVNRVLLLLNPHYIHNFCFKSSLELSDPFYLRSWICAAIGRTLGVLDLVLYLKSEEYCMELPFSHIYCKAVVLKLKGDLYFSIPAQASVCFPNLQTLHLSKINIEIARNSIVSFPNLKILHLTDVIYENEDSVHKLFSSCPVLDDLALKREFVDNLLCLNICIPSLTRLELDYPDDHVDTLQIDKLPNLKSLLILGHSLKAIRTASLNISSGFHNLTWLEVEKKYCRDWSIVVNNLLESMDNLEHLTMKMPRGKGIRGMHRSQGREVTSSSSALRTPRYEPPDTPPNDAGAEEDSPTDTPNPSQGTHGLSSGASATPMIHDTLPVATVVFGRLMPDRIARRITRIFQKAISSKGFNWKSVPTETKESYFTELKKEFRWPEEEETIIKKAFMKQAAKLYASMVSSWKTKWKDSKTKPECVSEADWPKWLEYWNKPEVAEKAKKNSENRKKEVNNSCSKHVGGSKPAVSYFMELQKRKEGVKPTLFELQKQMHMRKDGTYSDDHSKNILWSMNA